MVLWHGNEPIGICIFAAPAASLSLRSQCFGLSNARNRIAMSALNHQIWLLQRVVLHPTYRGAGIGAAFVRRACELCPVPWIETLSTMSHANPIFERAGFQRIGIIRKASSMKSREPYGRKNGRTRNANDLHRWSEPIYYVKKNECA